MRGLAEFVRLRTNEQAAAANTLSDLLARESIRDLVVLYAMAVDSHDVEALELMLHPDVEFDPDGGGTARGRGAVVTFLRGSMDGFRRMLHTPQTHVVHVEGSVGRGIATGHAELVTRRGVVVAAYEYEDDYGVYEGRWVFTKRRIRFVYATRSDEYNSTLPDEERVRMPGEEPRRMRA